MVFLQSFNELINDLPEYCTLHISLLSKQPKSVRECFFLVSWLVAGEKLSDSAKGSLFPRGEKLQDFVARELWPEEYFLCWSKAENSFSCPPLISPITTEYYTVQDDRS